MIHLNFENIFKQSNEKKIKSYLNKIYKEITTPNGIMLVQFCEYMNISAFIGKQLFRVFDSSKNNFLSLNDFIIGMTNLYCKGYKEISKIIFEILNLEHNNVINLSNLSNFIYFIINDFDCTLINKNLIFNDKLLIYVEEIIKNLIIELNGKYQITFTEFLYLNENLNSDIFLILFTYLISKMPFSENILNLFGQGLPDIDNKNSNENQISLIIRPSKYISCILNDKIINLFSRSLSYKEDSSESEIEFDEFLYDCENFQIENKYGLSLSINFKNKFISDKKLYLIDDTNIHPGDSIETQASKTINMSLKRKCGSKNLHFMVSNSNSDSIIFNNKFIEITEFKYNKQMQNKTKIELETHEIVLQDFCHTYSNSTGKLVKLFFILKKNEIIYFNVPKQKLKYIDYIKNATFFCPSFEPKLLDKENLKLFSLKFTCKMNQEVELFFESIQKLKTFYSKILICQNLFILTDKYIVSNKIKVGNSGFVSIATIVNEKKQVIIKAFNKNYLNLNPEKYRLYMNELEILKVSKHKSICSLVDNFEDLENLYLVIDYYQNGDLFIYFSKINYLLSEKKFIQIFYQIADGLNYLHKLNIIHRDLKLENLCVDNNNNIKIIDFGISEIIYNKEKLNKPYGTLYYASPEIFLGEEYGKEVDIWSLGVIIYVSIYRELPFILGEECRFKIIKNILNNELVLKSSKSKEINMLITLCLERNVNKRISSSKILLKIKTILFSLGAL